jgi:hypothetical protein
MESGLRFTLRVVGASLPMKTVGVNKAISGAKIVTPIRRSLGRGETTERESCGENESGP